MLDYGKFLYREKKQRQKNKQRTKAADLKTIKITFKISDHDLEVKKNQAEKFAENGHPLKVSLMLRGRENHYGDLAFEKMNKFIEMISEFYKIEKSVSRTNNNFTAMLKIHK
jgi:translation initiation factor IF-3